MSDVRQEGNIVFGDQAGRDITNVRPPRQPTFISRLHERLKADADTNPEVHGLIERLKHYSTDIDEVQPLGLEAKLKAADKMSIYAEAVRLKERFAMRLYEHNLSATAQEILLYAITKTHLHFRTFVEPLISEGADDATLRRVILESVISPMMTDLEENVLALMPDELEGIIWYLTANCFVTWVRNAELPPSA